MNFKKRLEEFKLKCHNKEALFVYSGDEMYKSLDANFPFEVDKNFWYLTGLSEPKSGLLIYKENNKLNTILFKPLPDPTHSLWNKAYISKEEATNITSIEEIYGNELTFNYIKALFENKTVGSIGLCNYPNYYNYPIYNDLINKAKENNINIFSTVNILTEMRLIKDEDEVNELKKAIKITKLGLLNVLDNLKNTKTEYEAVSNFESVVLKHNTTLAFDTICANGFNATTLHYNENKDKFVKDTLLLMDLGARSNYYCADISRTYPINGKFSKKQKMYYELVLDTNKKAIKMLKPGVNYKDVILFAKENLAEGLLKIGLIKNKEEVSKYYYHSVGHPLGLDTHDLGQRDIILKPGMVFTIEPGLYIKEEGIGIRIEDDVLITEKGNNLLSKEIIKEVSDIENYLSK